MEFSYMDAEATSEWYIKAVDLLYLSCNRHQRPGVLHGAFERIMRILPYCVAFSFIVLQYFMIERRRIEL